MKRIFGSLVLIICMLCATLSSATVSAVAETKTTVSDNFSAVAHPGITADKMVSTFENIVAANKARVYSNNGRHLCSTGAGESYVVYKISVPSDEQITTLNVLAVGHIASRTDAGKGWSTVPDGHVYTAPVSENPANANWTLQSTWEGDELSVADYPADSSFTQVPDREYTAQITPPSGYSELLVKISWSVWDYPVYSAFHSISITASSAAGDTPILDAPETVLYVGDVYSSLPAANISAANMVSSFADMVACNRARILNQNGRHLCPDGARDELSYVVYRVDAPQGEQITSLNVSAIGHIASRIGAKFTNGKMPYGQVFVADASRDLSTAEWVDVALWEGKDVSATTYPADTDYYKIPDEEYRAELTSAVHGYSSVYVKIAFNVWDHPGYTSFHEIAIRGKSAKSVLLGDANGDEIVDVRDIVRLKKYLANPATTAYTQNMDINVDGKIDTADLIQLKKNILGKVDSVLKAVTYPETIGTYEDLGYRSVNEYAQMANQGYDYAGNGHQNGSVIVKSPYYDLEINGMNVPVYAVPVFLGENGGRQAVQSFATVEVENVDQLHVNLHKKDSPTATATVLPKKLGVTATTSGNDIRMTVSEIGAYTVLVEQNSQDKAFTLFVRAARDEEKEIADYITRYGRSHVRVFEAGVHNLDYIDIPSDNYVLYLRSGALLLANHRYDIMSEAQNNSYTEAGATDNTGIGLKRYPFINCCRRSNVQIVGNGTVDYSRLDWHERKGTFFTFSNNISVQGITFVNPADWNLMTYRCNSVDIQDVTVLGYRTNSDGIAICNTTNASVNNCFARSGDDLFEVKTLGSDSPAPAQNIAFTNCYAWGSKARCFGITGEVNHAITGVSFKDCAILFRDAVWDNNRLGGLAVVVEETGAPISDINFENIEIFRDNGRPINCCLYNQSLQNCLISDVVFKNITYCAGEKPMFNMGGRGTFAGIFDGVIDNGTRLTVGNVSDHILSDNFTTLTVR